MDQFCNLFGPLEADDDDAKTVETVEAMEAVAATERISPFIAYEDGYEFPTLGTEIDEMMEVCVLIYPLAELRRKARANELQDKSGMILKMPLSHAEVMDVVVANREVLIDTKFGSEFYVEVLKAAEERNMMATTTMSPSEEGRPLRLAPATTVAFDDEFEKEELVYSIEVNHVRKRVTVCFRGSVTKKDWATDYEIYMKAVPNPMQGHSTQEPTIRVHNGFHDYLFEPNSRGVKGPNGEALSEYEEILQEHVLPVLDKHPGYKLYVTGHSLGAALATLFAFEAAALPDVVVPKPVSLFSIASPYCGDESFRRAHQLLEGLGKLRHLRISNHKDLVTLVPKFSFRWNLFDSRSHVGSLFKHVGLNLRLFEGTTPLELSYPKVRSGLVSSAFDELARGWDQTFWTNISWNPIDYYTWPFHSLNEYNRRLENNMPSLETLYLNELYSRQDIVGNLVPQF